MTNAIIYTAVAIIVLLGIISNAWYFTNFRITVGNIIFFAYMAIELVIFAAIIYLIGLYYSWTLKLSVIIAALCLNLFITNYLYKKRKKAQQLNQGDRQ